MTDISKEAVQDALYLLEGGNKNESHEHLQSLISAQAARIEELERRQYKLAYAIAGGEDAPGLLDSVPTSELVDMIRKERETARDAEAYAIRSARNDAMKEAAAVAGGIYVFATSQEDEHKQIGNWDKVDKWHHKALTAHAIKTKILALVTKEPNT